MIENFSKNDPQRTKSITNYVTEDSVGVCCLGGGGLGAGERAKLVVHDSCFGSGMTLVYPDLDSKSIHKFFSFLCEKAVLLVLIKYYNGSVA